LGARRHASCISRTVSGFVPAGSIAAERRNRLRGRQESRMSIVAVIDYGMGNLHSVAKAVEHVGGGGTRVLVTAEPRELDTADRVIFPGVGAMRDCMAEIRRLGFDDLIPRLVEEKPVLAICVGMQALMEH